MVEFVRGSGVRALPAAVALAVVLTGLPPVVGAAVGGAGPGELGPARAAYVANRGVPLASLLHAERAAGPGELHAAGAASVQRGSSGPAETARTRRSRLLADVLRGGLDRLVGAPGRLDSLAVRSRHGRSGVEVAVHVRLAEGPQRIRPALARLGMDVRLVGASAVEGYLPVDRLADLAGVPGIRSVWPLLPRRSEAFVGPAATLHGATEWHAAGLTGAGIRVGVIDGGFHGLGARLGTEAPSVVTALCWTDLGVTTGNLAECDNGETHGTAVVESLADVAPGIELYVADPETPLEGLEAVDWLVGRGVRIVNASWGSPWLFDGPGDGTSPYSDATYRLVDRAVAGGALWVNSAGNYGESGWTGPWRDADGDGRLEFSGTDEGNVVELLAGQDVAVALRWSDPWGGAANDYDLFLYREEPGGDLTLVGESVAIQDGGSDDDPFELIAYRPLFDGRYRIEVELVAGAAVDRLQLLVAGDVTLEHRVAAGTLPAPADSANPGMVSVGAVPYSAPSSIEPYSSRGPTADGRIKPDLVAADCAPTTIDPSFCGTSQAAPLVAGAAAVLLEATPSLDAPALAGVLRDRAVPLGSPIPNPTFGWGRLALGPPPAPAPAGLAFVEQPTFEIAGRPFAVDPVVRVVDATGRTVATGPGATLAITLSSAGGELPCPGGPTRTASRGVARFTDCTVSGAGAVVLSAASSGLAGATSGPIVVAPSTAPSPTLAVASSASVLSRPGTVGLRATLAMPSGTSVGRAVEVQTSADGTTWSTLVTASTDPTGVVSWTGSVDRNVWFRALYRGSADAPAVRSASLRVVVRRLLLLRPTNGGRVKTVAAGTTVTFTATVRPIPTPGTGRVLVRVNRRVGASWRLVASRTLVPDAFGRATLSWRFGTRGSWYLRAQALGSPTNAASLWSPIERYDVH